MVAALVTRSAIPAERVVVYLSEVAGLAAALAVSVRLAAALP